MWGLASSVHRASAVMAFAATRGGGGVICRNAGNNIVVAPATMGISSILSSQKYGCAPAHRSYGTTSVTRLAASAAAPGPSQQFLLKYDYIPDVLEKRGPYREGHLNLAKQLIGEGRCLSGGPTGPVDGGNPTGALFIFTDADAAKLFVEQDPYVANGIVTGHSIEEWTVVVQKE